MESFEIGDKVVKYTGDYVFEGWVVSIVRKRNPKEIRYVVEDERGLLFIFHERQLRLLSPMIIDVLD